MQPIVDMPEIKPRKMKFPFSDVTEQYFYDDNALVSSFMAALSAVFPPGEMGFIESVRYYRDEITDPELQERIGGFIGQEGHHSHQHKKINAVLEDVGWLVSRIEADISKKINYDKKRLGPKNFLAATVGMEHITAVMAEYMLTNPHCLAPLPQSIRDLLNWHAIEEIEHKSVAFDVYQEAVGERGRLRIVFALQTVVFAAQMTAYQVKLLRWAKRTPNFRDVVGAGKFFFAKKGLIRGMAKNYLDFYRDDFHPWDQDNRALIDEWKRTSGYVE
ncbi:MAG: metal-dependent hydrolase [Moraxellaceae bacterium]|nr:MAG: metal-dependent hydrolase [Moraxellaceae bacterium]